jgi:hypothetical protein
MKKQKKMPRANRSRRRFVKTLRSIGTVVLLCSAAGGGLAAYKRNYDITHDLSVIGNGTPSTVQIHDTGCQLCQRLRRNVASVKDEFDDKIQFRIADIHTVDGAALALRHNVPHVTLLLFDARGKLVKVLSGVRSPESLRSAFRTLL